jgi:Lon protease-like protein
MRAEVMELPLFPLNVVLFPGQTLPLHIFEPRYRVMIQRCIEQGQPFGVVLAQDEDDGDPHIIGTAARITQVERLPDGRMNIVTVGVERFVLQNVHEGKDEYLIGDAVFYPYKEDTPHPNLPKQRVLTYLRKYLSLLASVSGIKTRFDSYPSDPTAVAVFTAIALQVPLEQKQELLAIEGVNELLEREAELLRSEVLALTIVASSIRPSDDADDLIFSKN